MAPRPAPSPERDALLQQVHRALCKNRSDRRMVSNLSTDALRELLRKDEDFHRRVAEGMSPETAFQVHCEAWAAKR